MIRHAPTVYPWVKNLRYPPSWRLWCGGEPTAGLEALEREINLLPLSRIELQFLERSVSSLVTVLTKMFRLSYLMVKGKGKGHPCTGTEALYRLYGP